jgi:hypothetical protein
VADLDSMSMRDIIARTVVDTGSGYVQRVQGSLSIGGSRAKLTTSHDLSTGAFNYTTAVGGDFILRAITMHFSQPLTETMELRVDYGGSSNYDTLILQQQLDADTDFAFYPDSDLYIFANGGDQLNLRLTNSGGVGNVYATILVEVLV